jgi:hypothetical protein
VQQIRQGKQTATLVALAEEPRPLSVQLLRRRVLAGEDGETPASIEVVCDVRPDGERIAVQLTVVAVRAVSIDHLTGSLARACGHHGSDGKLATARAFSAEHPGMEFARLVFFELGDVRDHRRLISRGWPDYTSDLGRAMTGAADPGEAVPLQYGAVLAVDAQHRYLRQRTDLARDAARGTVTERLIAYQRGTVIRAVSR